MSPTPEAPFHDAASELLQVGWPHGVRLVRIVSRDTCNRYTARPIEFAADGGTQTVGHETMTVTNLAEPADAPGRVPAFTEASALDVEGRWVIFLRPRERATFPARVISSQGDGAYTVREQALTGAGTFADADGAVDVTAHNLAELSLGPGAAVDVNTIVLAAAYPDNGTPPTLRYLFDHPAYAKYLD
jgi:hypothetical protein